MVRVLMPQLLEKAFLKADARLPARTREQVDTGQDETRIDSLRTASATIESDQNAQRRHLYLAQVFISLTGGETDWMQQEPPLQQTFCLLPPQHRKLADRLDGLAAKA